MKIFESFRLLILENVLLQQLKEKYVGEGKPVSETTFNEIEKVCKNKFYLIQWLTKKVGTYIIKDEDIYKFEDYFEVFEKNKNKFELKDINQYKTREDVENFIRTCISIMEKNVEYEVLPKGDNYLSVSEIEKLESTGGAKFLGMYEDYQVFRVFKSDEQTWKIYRDLLGRCKGRGKGARIEICTISNYNYFERYLKEHRLSQYIVLYNLDDPKSPYQLHIESGQFMDKNDDEEIKINKSKFFDWLTNTSIGYTKEKIAKKLKKAGQWVPVEGKGFEDEKGIQGLWVQSDYGVTNKAEFKDGLKNGISKSYQDRKLISVTTYVNGDATGPYVEYEDGKVAEKGNYENGFEVGIWTYYNKRFSPIVKIDYSRQPHYIECFNENGKLQKIIEGDMYGKNVSTFYYSNGNVKAKGAKSTQGKTGIWLFYDKKGQLFARGKYARGGRTGNWEFYVTEIKKTKKKEMSQKFLYKVDLTTRKLEKFDEKGKLVFSGNLWGDKKIEKKFYDEIFYNDLVKV